MQYAKGVSGMRHLKVWRTDVEITEAAKERILLYSIYSTWFFVALACLLHLVLQRVAPDWLFHVDGFISIGFTVGFGLACLYDRCF